MFPVWCIVQWVTAITSPVSIISLKLMSTLLGKEEKREKRLSSLLVTIKLIPEVVSLKGELK